MLRKYHAINFCMHATSLHGTDKCYSAHETYILLHYYVIMVQIVTLHNVFNCSNAYFFLKMFCMYNEAEGVKHLCYTYRGYFNVLQIFGIFLFYSFHNTPARVVHTFQYTSIKVCYERREKCFLQTYVHRYTRGMYDSYYTRKL